MSQSQPHGNSHQYQTTSNELMTSSSHGLTYNTNTHAQDQPRSSSPASAILALPPPREQNENESSLNIQIEDIDFDDEFQTYVPHIQADSSTSDSESESSRQLHSTQVNVNNGNRAALGRTPRAKQNEQQIAISRSRRRRRDHIQHQNLSINNFQDHPYRLRSPNFHRQQPTNSNGSNNNLNSFSRHSNENPNSNELLQLPVVDNSSSDFSTLPRTGRTTVTPIHLQNQNQQSQRPFIRASNVLENGGHLMQVQGAEQQQQQPGQGHRLGQINENNDSFTLFEHIGMIGARNFFVPSVERASVQCVGCYKRAAFYMSMLITITCLFFLWNSLLHPYHMIGREFFISQRFQQMFLTDQDYYPVSAMLVVYLTMILSGWAVHYTNKPEYDYGFLTYLNSVRCLLVFGAGILCWHIYAHAKYYPDEDFGMQLLNFMETTLESAQYNRRKGFNLRKHILYPNKIWDHTQHVFKCCGIHEYRDWIPKNLTAMYNLGVSSAASFGKYVPQSCCSDSSADNMCDLSSVHKKGCLDAQLRVLTTETIWIINPGLFLAFFGHLAFYVVLGRLFSNTVTRNRTGRPFDPTPRPTPPADDGRGGRPRNHIPI